MIKKSDLRLVENRKPGRPPKAVSASGGEREGGASATTRRLNKAFRDTLEKEAAGKKKGGKR